MENNFNLKVRNAQNFMAIAERFGKTQTFAFLNYSQMVTLLALPADETEKFIAAKKAENKPVEEITVKQLREEIAKWKAERLFSFPMERKAVNLG